MTKDTVSPLSKSWGWHVPSATRPLNLWVWWKQTKRLGDVKQCFNCDDCKLDWHLWWLQLCLMSLWWLCLMLPATFHLGSGHKCNNVVDAFVSMDFTTT